MIDMVQSIQTPVDRRAFVLERELNFAHREIETLNKVTRMHRVLLNKLMKDMLTIQKREKIND